MQRLLKKGDFDFRRITLFMELMADTANLKSATPSEMRLDMSSMRNVPLISCHMRGRSKFVVSSIYGKNQHRSRRVQKFLHVAFRHFGDE